MSTNSSAQSQLGQRRLGGLSAEAARLLGAAGRHLDRRDREGAESALRGALALAPRHPEVLRLWGVACTLDGRSDDALTALRQALAQWPDDALLHNNLGSALRAAGDADGAIAAFRRACELAPGLAAAWYNLGKTLKTQAFSDAADHALARALALAPSHVPARIVYADNLKALGRIDEAERAYRDTLRLKPDAALAWWGLANLKTLRFEAADAAALREQLDRGASTGEDRALLSFALAQALEDQDRYVEAWQAYADANALRREQQPWDAAEFSRHVDHIIAAFGDATPTPDETARGSEIIFIVSLPRSGSTLVEQILAAHPAVEGAGELPDLAAVIEEESRRRGVAFPAWATDATRADWQRLGESYLARTARWRVSKPRSTDKALDNWLYLSAAAAMLPGATFVHCTREPIETALSCYRQWFNAGQAFSYSLDDIAAYLRDHDRLMRHWKQHWRGRILDQLLEALQLDIATSVHELLAFCALEFDPRCLAFDRGERHVRTASASQVRSPLQQSTRRAGRYGGLLDSLRAALE